MCLSGFGREVKLLDYNIFYDEKKMYNKLYEYINEFLILLWVIIRWYLYMFIGVLFLVFLR